MIKQVSLTKASAILDKALVSKPSKGKAKRAQKASDAAKPSVKRSKQAPGNATALRAKANDNLKTLASKKAHPDRIATVVVTRDGGYIAVSSNGGETFARLRSGDSKAFREIAQVGSSYAKAAKWHSDNPAPKPDAKLARGIEPRVAPHSAKAVADQKQPAKGKAKGKTATPKAAKNKQPSRGVERTYSVGPKKNDAKADTWRHHMLAMIQACKSTEAAKAKHAKSGKFSANKLDFNWANSQGYIKLDK